MYMEGGPARLVGTSKEAIFPKDTERHRSRMSVDDRVRSATRIASGERISDVTNVDTLCRCLGRVCSTRDQHES